jgi:heavy metal translocating P-type ATPase
MFSFSSLLSGGRGIGADASRIFGEDSSFRQQAEKLRANLERLSDELKLELSALKEESEPIINDLKDDFNELRSDLQPLLKDVRQEIALRIEIIDGYCRPTLQRINKGIHRELQPRLQPIEDKCRPVIKRIGQKVGPQIELIDEKYQLFVQRRIDPLLGSTQRSQLRDLLNGEAVVLSKEEQVANRRLGLGLGALSLSIMSMLVFAPLMPLAIACGLLASSSKYPHAYRQWKETGRLGAIHLICIYSLYLWFGGYAAAGSLGAALFGLMLKAKVVGENQSRNNLISLFQLQPDTVWIRVDEVEVEIPFDALKIGDTLVLHAGQIVPVDGKILTGVATIDQHMLTGEAQPVEKLVGDEVLASTMVISGRVDVRVEKTSAETTAGQIAAILNRAAQNSKPLGVSTMAVADRLALPTVALSLTSMPFIGLDGAVSLIGANTTTASYLSGSLSMLNYLNIAARNRILVKEAGALENLGHANTIVFDKTGTLTIEQPHVALIYRFGEMDERQILTFAAAAEARQTHPIARAILTAASDAGLVLPAIDEAHYEVGYGLKVRLVNGEDHQIADQPLVRVGSARYMAMEGIRIPEDVDSLTSGSHAEGHSLVMIAVGDELVGCLELKPTVRPEARKVIQGLRDYGLDLYIISGDQEAPTRKLAEDLGMTGYFANVLPEGKAALVEKLQAEGRKVCFIGDGINDAIAMRQAQVSVSLRGATTVATDTAQIILMEGNLDQLLYLFTLAKEFGGNLKLNIRYTSGISITAISGILFAGFSFYATEIFYSMALLGGMGIALKPLLDHRREIEAGALPAKSADDSEKRV